MKPILIVRADDNIEGMTGGDGDFVQWIADALRFETSHSEAPPIAIHDARRERVPDATRFSGVVVTGSQQMVSDRAPWSEDLAQWIRRAVESEQPVLGICFGHQLLAHAMGGQIGYREQGPDYGTVNISLEACSSSDELFAGLPRVFPAQMVHLQSVLRLPTQAVTLAQHPEEPHAAFRIGSSAWGVQFHPEFSVPVMQSIIGKRADDLRQNGQDPDAILDNLRPTPESHSLLHQFARLTSRRIS